MEERGFSGATDAEDGEELATWDAEIDAVEGLDGFGADAVPAGKVVGFDEGCLGRWGVHGGSLLA